MTRLVLELPELEARDLFRHLHQAVDPERFPDLYQQLQKHFFESMTILEFQKLIGEAP